MKKILFLLLILIPLGCVGQATHKNGVTVQDSLISEGLAKFKVGMQIGDSITGSDIWTVDSLVFSATDTAIWINGNRIALGMSVPGGGGGASAFLELTDTPGAYTPLYLIRTNAGGTALVFIDPATYAITNFLLVTTLGDYTISDTKANFNTALSDGSFAFDGGAFHDGFSDFLASEHVIWAITGVEDIHDDRIQESSVTQHAAAIIAGGSGMTLDGIDMDLGGTLDAPTTITGTEANNISINFSDAGDRSVKIVFRPADGLSMRAYTGDDYTGDSGFFAVDSTTVIMVQYDGAAEKSIKIDTNNATGIFIKDDDAGIGLIGSDNFSPAATDLSYTQKIYQDRNLGGQTVNATIYSPGDDEHGDLIVWDTATDTYISANVIPIGQGAGFMIVAFDTILYSNTTVDTIVTLPVGAVIWDIQVCVITTFNGSGTDLLDVGIIGDTDRYENDLDIAVTPVKFLGLANLADRIVGTSYVIFQYFDQNSDASTGLATIYVRYSIH